MGLPALAKQSQGYKNGAIFTHPRHVHFQVLNFLPSSPVSSVELTVGVSSRQQSKTDPPTKTYGVNQTLGLPGPQNIDCKVPPYLSPVYHIQVIDPVPQTTLTISLIPRSHNSVLPI
jgi:hypothetical protein